MSDAISFKVLILSATRYNMADEKTGEAIMGCKVTYVKDFMPVNAQNKKGVEIMQGILPYEEYDKLLNLPAYFKMEHEVSVSGKGKMSLKPISAVYLEPMEQAVGGGKK